MGSDPPGAAAVDGFSVYPAIGPTVEGVGALGVSTTEIKDARSSPGFGIRVYNTHSE